MGFDDVGFRIEMIIPHAVQQHGPRDDLVPPLQEIFQQTEFPGLKGNGLASPRHRALDAVHFQVADPKDLRFFLVLSRPSQQRVDARQELGEGKRFAEIIVGPGIEPLHPVIQPAQIAQKRTGRSQPFARKSFTRLKAIHARQHAVDDQQIVSSAKRSLVSEIAPGPHARFPARVFEARG